MSSNPNLKFPGYNVLEQLGETHASSVFRALKIDGDQKVIIKVIRIKDTTPETIARFRHEYELIKQINIDSIVRPLDFFSYEGSPALVLEDFGGVSLKSVIEGGLTIDRFLKMAIRISEILGSLHQLHVTHRDIKPHNILINLETEKIKITDFGISVVMEQDTDEFAPPSVVAGSLAYISPEQTGRLNCAVDYRTDMYSLGITFYEMLTGIRPFYSKDPLEMIHSHIAKVPEPLSVINPEIPDAISDIVMKLMAKSSQDRYQDCQGLASDLNVCLREWEKTGRIDSFELGSKDVSPHFNLPSTLVGRENHLSELEASFHRAGNGAVEVVLVSGEPGIGKSSLVLEMRKSVLAKRGYFISGQFDRYQRSVPYNAIVQAFQNLTRQLLAESSEQLEQWNRKLTKALGRNGKVITDIIPEIELITGKQPDLPDLGPKETVNRFILVFNNFVRVFADFKHPLVIFIDNIQWADVASLNLMASIVTDKLQNSLLLVCAYRNIEVDKAHPFVKAYDIINSADIPIHTLHLGPLDVSSTTDLISIFNQYDAEQIRPLAQVIHEKTKGNPFYINQFLKTIYEKGLLRIDANHGWTWDLQGIKNLAATENVVDFIAGKLHELPPASFETIKMASCIGNKFDLDLLTAVSNRSMDEIVFIADLLIRERMVVRRDHPFPYQ